MSDTNSPGGGFGDWEPDDSFDTAEADPEQVARFIQRLRVLLDLADADWDDFTDEQRQRRIELAVRLIAWGRRSGWVR